MIAYNPKAWFTFIFRFHKADTLRKLFTTIIGIAIYTGLIVFTEQEVLLLDKTNKLNNIGIVHSMLGFVISMLLVFRTNTAYERWWDGRKMWGQLINCNRNLAIKVANIIEDPILNDIKKLIIAFPFALKNHLRNFHGKQEAEIAVLAAEIDLSKNQHIPLSISNLTYQKVFELNKTGKINTAQTLIINNELQQWMEICGGCERIKNTPIPFSYSVFIKKFIFFYVMTLPFSMVSSLSYYCIPVVVFIFYVLASMELIAEEIENPFGIDANDLPIDEICKNARKSIEQIIK